MDEKKRHPPQQPEEKGLAFNPRLSEFSVSTALPLRIKAGRFSSKKEVIDFFQSAFLDQQGILEAVLDNTPAVIYVKDLKGKYLLLNRSFEELFHVDRSNVRDKTDFDLFPKEMAVVFRENDEEVLRRKEPVEFEESAPHDDGVHTYISLKFPILDAQLNPYAVAGISTDITERKRSEETIKGSSDYLEKIINSVADPIFVKDRQHRWVLLNDACCRFIGRSREELLGKSDYEFFPKEQADIFWKKDEEVFQTGKENLNEEYFTDAEGLVHTIVTKKTRYTDAQGVSSIVGVIRDMTEQKKAERELFQKNIELAQAKAEREYLELFACVASHDLQEPLQKVIAFGGLLKSHSAHDLDEKGRSFVEKIQMAAMRMSRMIEDLLQFTRVSTGEEAFEEVDLEVIVGEVLSDLDHRISSSKAKVEVGNFPLVYADRRQMHLLFLNLIANALKFQKKDTAPNIRIFSRIPEPGYVTIDIQDNGVGFENQYAEKLFQPFERLHRRDEFEGNGIGLAICKKIVMRHNGSIHAKAKPGEGAVFSVTLPGGSKAPKI